MLSNSELVAKHHKHNEELEAKQRAHYRSALLDEISLEFEINSERMPEVVELVAQTARRRGPFRHFRNPIGWGNLSEVAVRDPETGFYWRRFFAEPKPWELKNGKAVRMTSLDRGQPGEAMNSDRFHQFENVAKN